MNVAGFDTNINHPGLEKLEHDLAQRFAAGVTVPLDGTEAEAARSVTQQLQAMGATPDRVAVHNVVRQARQNGQSRLVKAKRDGHWVLVAAG